LGWVHSLNTRFRWPSTRLQAVFDRCSRPLHVMDLSTFPTTCRGPRNAGVKN
jgi:hypothetical protein